MPRGSGRPGIAPSGIVISHPSVQASGQPVGPPTIATIAPATIPSGAAATITITGTGFTAASIVKLDGNGVVTHYVSATQLTADLPSIVVPRTAQVTVDTAGQVSAPKPLTIT